MATESIDPGPVEHRQFDFWIGAWDVFGAAGVIVGHSRIEAVSDGFGISEHWIGATGSRGVSYNAWNPAIGRWQQFWVGNSSGDVLLLEGGITGSSMLLEGVRRNALSGKVQLQRISWTPNADGSIRQHWQQSDDGGRSWTTAFDGLYRRKPA